MKLDFIPLDRLAVSTANMRHAKRPPDVSDMLPTVRARGILVPLIVRPNGEPDHFEILAGRRRLRAAQIMAEETGQAEPLPCAILDSGDDAQAIEASLIENLARLDPDEVTQWETFTRLVKAGRHIDDIALTFGLPEPMVRRVLALGNLLPRIRAMYTREEIDRVTIRQLTLASKSQQRAWLALADDPKAHAPSGYQLKAWLFGGPSISAAHALFDVEASGLAVIADLFDEQRYVVDRDAFWAAQDAAVEARRQRYLEAGWADVVILPPAEPFHSWDYEKTPKRKGGRVFIDVRSSGEVIFHEGYRSRKDAQRSARSDETKDAAKPPRPEVSGPLQSYIDLHRHAALRAALLDHPETALRLMVAHAIIGSPLWSVRPEPQSARSEETRESVETSRGETLFDERRRAALALLGIAADEPTLIGSSPQGAGGDPLAALFWRLLDLPDAAMMEIIAILSGESLMAGSAAVAAAGLHIGLDMADWWQADEAFFALLRDREPLLAIVAEVAGEACASANAREPGKALKRIVADALSGTNGRSLCERWVPRWMAFPPAAYTARGGVGTLSAHALAEAARGPVEEPEPPAPSTNALSLPAEGGTEAEGDDRLPAPLAA